jgi:hypothetical protein
MLGVFPEILVLANGVSVYGGYDASWQRSPSNVTKITGSGPVSEAVNATVITSPTTIQPLTLAPGSSSLPGESSYGIGGAGSPALVADHVTVLAARGTDGSSGVTGAPGFPGGNGHSSNGVKRGSPSTRFWAAPAPAFAPDGWPTTASYRVASVLPKSLQRLDCPERQCGHPDRLGTIRPGARTMAGAGVGAPSRRPASVGGEARHEVHWRARRMRFLGL